jgi:hypothetical protein
MGLEKIIAIRKRLERIDSFIVEAIAQSVIESAPIIEDLNIAQLQRGQRADNSFLPNYSPVSVAKYGKPPGPIRLFDQGDFYRGITLKGDKTGFKLVGEDQKTPKLTEAYGDNVLGLSNESLTEFKNDYLIDDLRIKTKDYLVYGN